MLTHTLHQFWTLHALVINLANYQRPVVVVN